MRTIQQRFLKLYFKPFYRREDFDDERYQPFFSPQVYPGQTIRITYKSERHAGDELLMSFYLRTTHSKREITSKIYLVEPGGWQTIEWTLPDTDEEAIDEIGLKFENSQYVTYTGIFYVDKVLVEGKGCQKINFAKEKEEFMTVTPFTFNRGRWTLDKGRMHVLCPERAEAYTGNYYTQNVCIKADIQPEFGPSHNIAFRVKGAMMGYYAGFNGKNKVQFIKNDHGLKVLAEKPFKWEHGKKYQFEIKAEGNKFNVSINGKIIFEIKDNVKNYHEYGMYGYALLEGGRARFEKLEASEL